MNNPWARQSNAVMLFKLLGLASAAVTAGLAILWTGEIATIWMRMIFIVLIVSVPLLAALMRYRLEFSELAHFFALSFGIFYVIPLAYALLIGDPLIESNAFPEAMNYLIIGGVCFYAAYYSGFGKTAATLFPNIARYSFGRLKFRMILYLFLSIATASFVFVIVRSGGFLFYISNLGERVIFWENLGYLWWGVLLVIPSSWAYYGYLVETRGKAHVGFWIFLGLVLLFLLSLGSRWNIISLSFGLLIVHHHAARRVRIHHLILLALVLLVFSFLYQFYRNYLSIEHYMNVYQQGNLAQRFIFGSLGGFNSLVVVLEGVPEIMDFQYGRSLVDLVYYPIPRLLWPAKPELTAMGFSQTFFPEAAAAGVIQGIPYLGELYLNFGPLGITVGMMVLGFFCRSLYAYVRLNGFNTASLLIYVCSIEPLMRGMRGGLFAFLTHFLMNLIPVVIILVFSAEQRAKVKPRSVGRIAPL